MLTIKNQTMTDSVLTEEIVVNNINYIREPKGMFDAYLAFLRNFGYPKAGGTGFPTIYHAMVSNGSPEPTYDTGRDCTCFLTKLPARIEVEVLYEGVNGKVNAEDKAGGKVKV
jgi:hypothetical protein